MTASYDDRIRAVENATRLMRDMAAEPQQRALDRFEVTELARFLLGLDEPADAEGGSA
jgi:hypothetical protein